MSIVKRQIRICLTIAVIVVIVMAGAYYYVFAPSDLEPFYAKEIYHIPFILFVPSVAIIIGLLFGIASGSFYKSEIKGLDESIYKIKKGESIEQGKEPKITDIREASEKLLEVQNAMLEQVRRTQVLATEKTEEQEKLVQSMVKEERNRLARELHDSVSQQLFAASMLISAVNESSDASNEWRSKQLKLTEGMIQQAQLEMRALLLHLRPVQLKDKSLKEGVENLLHELKQKVPFDVRWNVDDLLLEKGVEDHLFRILQESVSNTLRHAKANRLDIYIVKHEQSVIMRVIDDGQGFDTTSAKAGSYGLQNMRERALEIGGVFKIISFPNQGTRVEVRVPIVNVGDS
ncbi:sensor histidine kinase [Pradoshia sp.]